MGAYKIHMKQTRKNNSPCNCILKQYAVLLLFLLPFFSSAHIDTAVAKLQDKYQAAKSDSSRAFALKDICWYYRYINLDSAVSYGKRSIELAQQIGNRRLEGDVKRFIGIAYWHYAYEEECLEWIYASLKIAEEIGDKSGEAYCYDNIGNTFFSQGIHDKALENFSKAKEIFTQIKDDKGIAYTLLHSSWVYAGRKDFNTALTYIYKAVELRRKIGDSLLVSGAMKEVANVYRGMGRYDEALVIYRQSKIVFEKANMHYSLADDYQQMAETFRLAGMNDSSVFYGLKSMEVTAEFSNYRQLLKTSKTLQQAYTGLKNYERALFYQNIYYENKERLLNDRIALKLERKDAEHEFEIKAEHLRNRNLDIVIILLALLFVMLVIALVIYFSQKKTKQYNHLLTIKNGEITKQKQVLEAQTKELTKLNEVKDKMFSVVSHDIRSPLTSLQSMLYLYNNAFVTPDEIKDLMPAITLHVNNTASFVDNLLYWAKSQLKGLKVSKTMFNLKECIQAEIDLLNTKATEKNISFVWNAPSIVNVFADKDMMAIVMRNILNNALKFSNENSKVQVVISDNAVETQVCIKDEGKGMTQEQLNNLFVTNNSTSGTADEVGAGLGMILSKDFVDKNDGKIWVESKVGEGSSFYVVLRK
jgi:two-component system sensor histidine kinase/response regulator